MIDGQRREFYQMKNRQAILFEPGGERHSGPCLMRAGKRTDHPPVAPQEIRAPRAATLNLQKLFLRPAEFTQTLIAWNDDLFSGIAGYARVPGNDRANKLPVNVIGGQGLVRQKAGVIKKLPHHARKGKTAVSVLRFRITRAKRPFAGGRVRLVLPHQFVGKGEAVALEFKTSRAGAG